MPSILNSRARISFFFCISYLHEKYSRENSVNSLSKNFYVKEILILCLMVREGVSKFIRLNYSN